MISISDVRVNLVNGAGKLNAFASITIDDELVIKGLRIIEGNKGLFVAFPSTYSESDDTYYDNVFPIKKETRDYITNEVIEEYKCVAPVEETPKESAPKQARGRSTKRR